MSTNQTTELEEEILDQDDDTEHPDNQMQPFNPSDISIGVENKSLDLLIKRITYKEIDMNTDFQRHADLWDNRKMSLLIESILIRFPLPPFYFDASDDSNWLIVDGLQRLSSIKKFVIDQKLKLTGLEFLDKLNGKTFSELDRVYQRRIEECQVTLYLIKPGTPPEVKYSVFKRINTGGLTLNSQEIRNALAKPIDRELLNELAGLPHSIEMLGDLSKRMKDQELVLRFWAFYQFDYLDPNTKRDIALLLNNAMEEIKKGDDNYRNNFKNKYTIAIERCYQLLGKTGFEKDPESSTRRLKNSTLFEVWMVAMAKLSHEQFSKLISKKEIFKEKNIALLKDSQFKDAITYSTQKKIHVEIRHNKVNAIIQEILND